MVVVNDIRNSNAVCTMQSDSSTMPRCNLSITTAIRSATAAAATAPSHLSPARRPAPAHIKKIASVTTSSKDLQAWAFYFSAGASSIDSLRQRPGPAHHQLEYRSQPGRIRAIDADSSGTKRKAFFSGYFDGNSNGRSASGESGLISTFADVDVGPLYITGTTVAEANDKRTLMGSSTTAARMPAVATTLYTSTSTVISTPRSDL